MRRGSCRWASRRRASNEFSRGLIGVLWVEADEGEFGTVVGGGEAVGLADAVVPGAGKTRGFVDVAVEGDSWLAVLDEALDRDAADVDVERRVIDHFSVECCSVEFGLVGGAVEEHDGVVEGAIADERMEIVLEGAVLDGVFGDGDGSVSGFGRDATGVDELGDVVFLPVLEHEGGGRDTGVAVDVVFSERDAAVMDVGPDTLGGGGEDGGFFGAAVVVSEDEEDARILVGELLLESLKALDEEIVNEVAVFQVHAAEGGESGGEKVSAEEDGCGTFVLDGIEESIVAAQMAVQIGNKEAAWHVAGSNHPGVLPPESTMAPCMASWAYVTGSRMGCRGRARLSRWARWGYTSRCCCKWS